METIYLDYNSTTPLDPRVLEAMMPYFTDLYGNASSSHHFGQKAKKAVDKSRGQVADLVGANEEEIIFTSGATESINLAMKGLAHNNSARKHIVTVSTEHKAVLDVSAYLEGVGFEVTYLPVQSDGLLDLDVVLNAIRDDTLLVSVMLANNETGVIQPIKKISELAHEKGAFFMTDATQAVGKIPVDVDELGIDLMAFSAHKFYGPKGVGGLFLRKYGEFIPKINPQVHGGGHEKGFRSGTLNGPGIVGFGAAAELAAQEMESNKEKIQAIRDDFEREILKLPGIRINGHKSRRLFNTSNIYIPDFDSQMFIQMNPLIAVSNGSACTSAVQEPSHVLKAMGLSDEEAWGSLRVSFGKNQKRKIFSFLRNLLFPKKT